MKTIFLRVLEADDKTEALLSAVRGPARALGRQRFDVDPASFASVPRSPFAYWVSERLRRLFKELPAFEAEERTARRGPSTCDDVRYVRCWWEVVTAEPHGQGVWRAFAKGGAFSPFFADVHLVVDWEPRRSTFLGFLGRPGREIEKPESVNCFFRPGLTWPLRTSSGLSMRAMPAGCIFGHKGPAAFVENDDSVGLLALLAAANSRAFRLLVSLQLAAADAAARSYEVGLIQTTPVPSPRHSDGEALARLARRAWSLKRSLDTRTETSHAFTLPALLQVAGADPAAHAATWSEHVRTVEAELVAIQAELNERCFALYGIDEADRRAITEGFGTRGFEEASSEGADDAEDDAGEDTDENESTADATGLAVELVSWAVGVAFGRFDILLATGERPMPTEPEPFDPLPACSPGMLTGEDGLPLARLPAGYPLAFPCRRVAWRHSRAAGASATPSPNRSGSRCAAAARAAVARCGRRVQQALQRSLHGR